VQLDGICPKVEAADRATCEGLLNTLVAKKEA
jgi:hypothetical protein